MNELNIRIAELREKIADAKANGDDSFNPLVRELEELEAQKQIIDNM